jgi:hypothetical protein
MRNQAGNPESSPQQQNDNQSSPEHTRHAYSPNGIFVAPPSLRLSRGRLARAGRANHAIPDCQRGPMPGDASAISAWKAKTDGNLTSRCKSIQVQFQSKLVN